MSAETDALCAALALRVALSHRHSLQPAGGLIRSILAATHTLPGAFIRFQQLKSTGTGPSALSSGEAATSTRLARAQGGCVRRADTRNRNSNAVLLKYCCPVPSSAADGPPMPPLPPQPLLQLPCAWAPFPNRTHNPHSSLPAHRHSTHHGGSPGAGRRGLCGVHLRSGGYQRRYRLQGARRAVWDTAVRGTPAPSHPRRTSAHLRAHHNDPQP